MTQMQAMDEAASDISPPLAAAVPIRSVAIISNIGFSIPNFRGPMIRDLVTSGLRVYALAPDYDDELRATVRALGAEPIDYSLERTGTRPLRDLADGVRLARLLRHLRPDSTWAYTVKPIIYGSLAAKVAGVRHRYASVAGLGFFFTDEDGDRSLRRRLLRKVVLTLYRLGLRACERVFFENPDDRGELLRSGLVHGRQAVLLEGTGVDLDYYVPARPVVSPPVFLFIGRLLREKGVPELVQAARLVRAACPEARICLLGDFDTNPGGLSHDEVAGWASEGVIEWVRRVDDVRTWISQSSVFVLPSWREGKPRSTQEAMAMGRPVVTTDVPGCRGTVEDGVNGFLVPVRNPAALAEAMLRFLRQPGLIESMGRESLRIARERFDVRQINRTILNEMGVQVSNRPCIDSARSAS
jgi:glycosyltransferase involved in cell wall biosynthesis